MQRRPIGILMRVLSLVLTVAVLTLWARSLTVADWLSHSRPIEINGRYARAEWILLSAYGDISITRAYRIPIDASSAAWLKELDRQSGLGWSCAPVDSYPPSWRDFVSGLVGFSFGSGTHKQGRANHQFKSVEVPDWVLLLAVSMPGVFGAVKLIRGWRERRRRGFPLDAPLTGETT